MRPAFRALTVTVIAAVFAVAPGLAQVTEVQRASEKLDITAFAVNMSNIGPGTTATVEIRIDSWSSEKERQHLITTMVDKGNDQLLRELQKTKSHGRFSIPGWRGPDPHQMRLGHDLHYAHQVVDADGGRRIVIATDRYIGFWEARNQPRTTDYPFTLFEIHVGKDGKGQGKMAVATRITFDKKKNTVELENYSSEPVRLNEVTVKVRK